MSRITRKNLDWQLKFAATAKGWDIETPIWKRTEDGHNLARVGAVFLEHNTYSGWKLCEMITLGGGENVIYHAANAREMYAYLQGVIQGGSN